MLTIYTNHKTNHIPGFGSPPSPPPIVMVPLSPCDMGGVTVSWFPPYGVGGEEEVEDEEYTRN
jgi:hypothetical protein